MTETGGDPDAADLAPPSDSLPESAGSEGSVRVVGTAHVSHQSVEEVEAAIDESDPDVVAVELDEGRYRQLKGQEPDDLEASDLLSGGTVFQFMAYMLLSYVQKRLGDEFDIQPGAEMLAAVEAAEARGMGIALVDRDIQVTMRRLWSRMRFREKVRMTLSGLVELGSPWVAGLTVGFFVGFLVGVVAEALAGPFVFPAGLGAGIDLPLVGTLVGLAVVLLDGFLVTAVVAFVVGAPIALLLATAGGGGDYEEFDIDDLTEADVVTAMMEEFRRFSPGAAAALIDERDAYIAHRLVALRSAGYDVVAVVGAGHREGIEHYLAHPEELPPADSLVGDVSGSRLLSVLYKVVGYAFTLGFLAFFVLLAIAGVRQQTLLELFVAWFLVNGIIAAGLARLAGAHWTSAGVGGAIAWLTSVNPLLAPGWFAGYVELRYLDVNVSDVGKLNEIMADEEAPIREVIERMREVPLFRLVMVVALTNLGSFVASILFATVLLPYLSAPVGGVDGIATEMLNGASRSIEFLLGGLR
jgi:pheromone shutdown protein TraB